MPKFKKGSKEAKAFMAKLRAKRAKVSGAKKTVKPSAKKAAKPVAKKVARKVATKRHTDTKSHNVNIRVVSGVGNIKPTPTIQKLAKSIAAYTQNNDHNNAVLKLAKYLKNKDAISMMNSIITKHKSLGYMPQEFQRARDYYQKELLNQAKYKLTGVNYDAIKKAF